MWCYKAWQLNPIYSFLKRVPNSQETHRKNFQRYQNFDLKHDFFAFEIEDMINIEEKLKFGVTFFKFYMEKLTKNSRL